MKKQIYAPFFIPGTSLDVIAIIASTLKYALQEMLRIYWKHLDPLLYLHLHILRNFLVGPSLMIEIV